MSKLKVPTVQHLARNYYESPKKVEDAFVKMALNPPFFSYNALNDAARDCLLFNTPEEQVIKGIRETEKRKNIQNILVEAVPLLCDHFKNIQPDFVHDVAPRYYPIGRNMKVPFKSVFIYGVGGQIYLPWFIFWKTNPLNDLQLSLFVTLALEILRQDPELEKAKFEILDFSAKNSKEGRRLKIIDTTDIPTLSPSQTAEMLAIFVEGFEMAEAKLQNVNIPSKRKESEAPVDTNQMPLWDNY